MPEMLRMQFEDEMGQSTAATLSGLRLLTGAVACLHLLIDMAVTAAVGDLALLGELSTEFMYLNCLGELPGKI